MSTTRLLLLHPTLLLSNLISTVRPAVGADWPAVMQIFHGVESPGYVAVAAPIRSPALPLSGAQKPA